MADEQDIPVLDLKVIESLKELGGEEDPTLFVDLVDLFVCDASKNIEALAAALASGDSQALQRAAHAMKSSSANVGALRMSKLCFEMEKLGRSGTCQGAETLVRATREQFSQVSSALQALKS
jgi:HPt (histidine-containing phosphotransfer) domain-containing protein